MCPICLSDLTPENRVTPPPCGHVICKECTDSYIREQIDSNKVIPCLNSNVSTLTILSFKVKRIGCPTDKCGSEWEETYVEQFLEGNYLERYIKLKKLAIVNTDPSLRWCIRPGCVRYNKGDASKPRIRCDCGMEMCFNCNLQWHPNRTCQKVAVFLLLTFELIYYVV